MRVCVCASRGERVEEEMGAKEQRGEVGKGKASQQTHSGLVEVCVCVGVREEDEFIVSLHCRLELGGLDVN